MKINRSQRANRLIGIIGILIFTSIIGGFQLFMVTDQNSRITSQSITTLPQSADTLDDHISYLSSVDRVLETQTITVNLTTYAPGMTNVYVNMTYSNGTLINYTMDDSGTTDVWVLSKNFEKDAPLGVQSFVITTFNGATYSYSSARTFQILDSYPSIGITLSDTDLKRGDTLYFNITPTDAEDDLASLDWNVKIVSTRSSQEIFTYSKDSQMKLQFEKEFPYDFVDSNLGECYVEATVTDLDGNSTKTREYFTISDNPPQIHGNPLVKITNPEGTNLDDDQILRVYGQLEIRVNVSDADIPDIEAAVESPAGINLKVTAEGPLGTTISSFSVSSLINTVGETSHFLITKAFPLTNPAGTYTISIVPYQTINSEDSEGYARIVTIELMNNIPNASAINYTINNRRAGTTGLRIPEHQNLNINVSVKDVDPEGIEFVKICLVDKNNEWKNFTIKNDNVGELTDIVEFSIRAKDLTPGQWVAWVYVIDTDGVEVGSLNVMAFDIVPDTLSAQLPWITLVIGLLIGVAISMFIIGGRYFGMKREYEELMLSAPSPSSRKTSNQQKSKESKKPEASDKRAKTDLANEEKSKDTDEKPMTKGQRKLARRLNK